MAAYFLLIPTVKFILSFYYDENYIESTFDSEAVNKYLENDYALQSGKTQLLSLNRNTCIERSSTILLQDPKAFLIGNGIGSLTQSRLFKTPLSDIYHPTYYFFFTFSYVLLELGWIGFILFILFYAFIAHRFYRHYKKIRIASSNIGHQLDCLWPVYPIFSCGIMLYRIQVIILHLFFLAYVLLASNSANKNSL